MIIVGFVIVLLIIISLIYYKYPQKEKMNDIGNDSDIIKISTSMELENEPDNEDSAGYRIGELSQEGILNTMPHKSPMTLISALKQVSRKDITDDGCIQIEKHLDKYKDNVLYDTEAQPIY